MKRTAGDPRLLSRLSQWLGVGGGTEDRGKEKTGGRKGRRGGEGEREHKLWQMSEIASDSVLGEVWFCLFTYSICFKVDEIKWFESLWLYQCGYKGGSLPALLGLSPFMESRTKVICSPKWTTDNHSSATTGETPMMQRSSLASLGPLLSLQCPWTITPYTVVNSRQEAALEYCMGKKIKLNFKETNSGHF